MFPKFIQVGLYLGGRIYVGAYIRDVNWVSYLGAYIRGWLIYGGRINGILQYLKSKQIPK